MLHGQNISSSMGFSEPVLDSQEAFRTLLTAMAHPGRVVTLQGPSSIPEGLHRAAWVALLTLCDPSVRLFTDLPPGHCAAFALETFCRVESVPDAAQADFVLLTNPSAWRGPYGFRVGTEKEPELGATVILQVSDLFSSHEPTEDHAMVLTGPGIRETVGLTVPGIPADFWTWRNQLETIYPRGIDLLMTCNASLAAIPRSVHLDVRKGRSCTSP